VSNTELNEKQIQKLTIAGGRGGGDAGGGGGAGGGRVGRAGGGWGPRRGAEGVGGRVGVGRAGLCGTQRVFSKRIFSGRKPVQNSRICVKPLILVQKR
jgi:hypothetical protein